MGAAFVRFHWYGDSSGARRFQVERSQLPVVTDGQELSAYGSHASSPRERGPDNPSWTDDDTDRAGPCLLESRRRAPSALSIFAICT